MVARILASSFCTRPLAQHEFLNLAGSGGGQGSEYDRFRRLVVCKLAAAEIDDLVRGCRRPRPELDEGARRLAPFLVGSRHFAYSRQTFDDGEGVPA
jgi:hypothetical protein